MGNEGGGRDRLGTCPYMDCLVCNRPVMNGPVTLFPDTHPPYTSEIG